MIYKNTTALISDAQPLLAAQVKPYKTLMEGIKAYVNKQAYKHTYICTLL
jgi:hypothetical protein